MKHFPELQPDKDFVGRVRNAYLAAFHASYPHARMPHGSRLMYFARGLAVGAFLIILGGGASVYADQTNAGPESPFYSMKRAYEAVNVYFTPLDDKSLVHMKLAERRLGEIGELENRGQSDRRVQKLLVDLHDTLRDSLATLPADEFAETMSGLPYETSVADIGSPEPFVEEKRAMTPQIVPTSSSFEGENSFDEINQAQNKESRRMYPRDRKVGMVCAGWRGFMAKSPRGFTRVVESHPELIASYEAKCGSYLGGE